MRSRIDTEARRSFNAPHTAADFAKWLKCDSWDVEEAIALSLRRDPSKVKWETVAPYCDISRVAQEFYRRRDLLERAIEVRLLPSKMAPKTFVEWAFGKELAMPSSLTHLGGRENVASESSGDEQRQLSVLEALHAVLGINAETIPADRNEKSDDECLPADEVVHVRPSNASGHRKADRAVRDFIDVALHLEVESATYAKWVDIADWYCFEVIDRNLGNNNRLDGGDSSPRHSVDSTTYSWVVPAQKAALAAIKSHRFSREKVTQKLISEEVSAGLTFKDKGGKPIDPEYIRRKAFSPNKWWKKATSEAQEE